MKYSKLLSESISSEKNIKVKMNASAAVIMKEGEKGEKQILLIQRSADDHWPGHWEFPRGKCDHGKDEDTIKCVKREVKEETGLDIKVVGLIDTFQYLADGGKRLTTCYNYLCKMQNEDQPIKLSHEHQDYKFIREVGEAEMLVLPDQKKTIEKVLNGDRPLVSYPDNTFTKNNRIEEYLQCLNQIKT
jgi:mutator protein MutT